MLGLADYDSPIGAEDSPAPVAQAPAPAGSQPPVLLSIVDYFDDDKPEEPAPPAGLAVSLDDEALQRAVPRMVGGVQISVVKKTPPRPADEGNGVLPGDAVASDSTAASGPEFKLLDSPSGSVDQKLLEKFASLVEQTKKVTPRAHAPAERRWPAPWGRLLTDAPGASRTRAARPP